MNFLADQDVYAVTTRFLRGLGHDVVTAFELGMFNAKDVDLLQAARDREIIFITRDRDFGALVFVQASGPGVIYLRILPSTLQAIHRELFRVLSLYDEPVLRSSFVVIEPARHRIRKV